MDFENVIRRDLGPLSKEQIDFLGKTYQSNERMIHLINDLLNVTRIEEGRYLFKTSWQEIGSIVKGVIDSYLGKALKKRIKILLTKPEELPKVKVDVEKIKLAISNLIENAIEYTEPGGEVTISLKSDKKEIEFSIQDTGIGIPEDQQQRVFSRFFRATNAVKMETEGTGLGLYITKNIIEAHKGRIWFQSKEGEGSTFYFTLPLGKES
jgi:signal transduction histidine kinase